MAGQSKFEEKKMKNFFYATCLILLVSSAATAQQETELPRVEIFGGYSHLIGDQLGFNVSAAGNINKWLGVVGDFSRLSSKITEQNITEKITGNIYLFGPQFSYRGNKRVTPFARVLLGAATVKSKASLGSQSLEISETNFSYGAGGGLDIRVSKNVAIRAVQADYFHTSAFGEGQHNGRLSFGVVFRFGSK
jgi:opacity protein-like surface antigen